MKKKILLIITSLLIGIIFLLYGPYPNFRNLWITSAMKTKSHRYLATMIYSEEQIQKVLEKNTISEVNEITNPNLIKIKKYKKSKLLFKDKYDKQILSNTNKKYKVIKIQEKLYNGYLVVIYDPSKIELVTSKFINESGEKITTVAKRENALIAINGGGFYDPNWTSNGAIPHGTVIKNGEIISNYKESELSGFIGFNKDNKLIIGKMTMEEALKIGYKDAMEFGPMLIINGKKSKIKGNGGWGISSRTAIAQRQDGIVLFLVINGRIPTSIGASMNDITQIMYKYKAYNAANLDGGSSTALVINNKVINTPVGGGKDGLRKIPTFWIVKK